MDYNRLLNQDLYHIKKQFLHLKEALETYKYYYDDKKFKIELSDGQSMKFEIRRKNLPHLLGFNKDKYMYDKLFKYLDLDINKNSLYNLINYLSENYDDITKEITECIDNQTSRKIGYRSVVFSSFDNLIIPNYVICNRKYNRIGTIASNYVIIKDLNYEECEYSGLGIFNNPYKNYAETLIKIAKTGNYVVANNHVLLPNKLIINDEKVIDGSKEKQLKLIKNYADFIKQNNLILITKDDEIKEASTKMKIKVR